MTITQNNPDETGVLMSDCEGTIQRIKDAIGDVGYEIANNYVGDCVVNESQTVMWFPDEKHEPMGVRVDAFNPDVEWELVDSSESNLDVSFDVITTSIGDVTHRIDARHAHTLSRALDMSLESFMSVAEITEVAPIYPVLFDLNKFNNHHHGKILIAPITKTPEENFNMMVEQ